LYANVKGAAQHALNILEVEVDCPTFEQAVAVLERRFTSDDTQEQLRQQLRNRKRQPNEPLRKYFLAVQELMARLGITANDRQINHLLAGLSDEEKLPILSKANDCTPDQLLKLAEYVERMRRGEKMAANCQAIQPQVSQDDQTDEDVVRQLQRRMEETVAEVQKIAASRESRPTLAALRAPQPDPPKTGGQDQVSRTQEPKPRCQLCKKLGHTADKCWGSQKKKTEEKEMVICQLCGKRNHTADVCRQYPIKENRTPLN
jgi:hypothetical protein